MPCRRWRCAVTEPDALLSRGATTHMTAPDLPAELKAALDAKLQGVSRNEAAGRAALISQTYRAGGGSGVIACEKDALAYALARMPATYAALTASLNALREVTPGFAPQSLLDVGAGPGTAGWAAAEAFSSLQTFHLIDANSALRTLALELARHSTRLRVLKYQRGDARAALADAGAADLVVASYMIGELGGTERIALADLLWTRARDTLVVVEPGTPAGYRRILALREQLVASGAHVAAPCPHDKPCPLRAPDWCHFGQRLPRSRGHLQVKGAEVPFEDEKFSYVALTRRPVAQHPVRVLMQPVVTKVAISAKMCADRGIVNAVVPRRQKTAYQRFRKIDWGDAMFELGEARAE